jgi:hypothetical protein
LLVATAQRYLKLNQFKEAFTTLIIRVKAYCSADFNVVPPPLLPAAPQVVVVGGYAAAVFLRFTDSRGRLKLSKPFQPILAKQELLCRNAVLRFFNCGCRVLYLFAAQPRLLLVPFSVLLYVVVLPFLWTLRRIQKCFSALLNWNISVLTPDKTVGVREGGSQMVKGTIISINLLNLF